MFIGRDLPAVHLPPVQWREIFYTLWLYALLSWPGILIIIQKSYFLRYVGLINFDKLLNDETVYYQDHNSLSISSKLCICVLTCPLCMPLMFCSCARADPGDMDVAALSLSLSLSLSQDAPNIAPANPPSSGPACPPALWHQRPLVCREPRDHLPRTFRMVHLDRRRGDVGRPRLDPRDPDRTDRGTDADRRSQRLPLLKLHGERFGLGRIDDRRLVPVQQPYAGPRGVVQHLSVLFRRRLHGHLVRPIGAGRGIRMRHGRSHELGWPTAACSPHELQPK